MSPLEIVVAFVREKDPARAVAHLAEDVTFAGPLLSVHGRAEYRALLDQFLPAHLETRILHQLATADQVVLIDELAVLAPSGERITLAMAEWFRVRDGSIVEHRVFYDPRDFARAFSLPSESP